MGPPPAIHPIITKWGVSNDLSYPNTPLFLEDILPQNDKSPPLAGEA